MFATGRSVETFYLSDTAHNYFKYGALNEEMSISNWIELKWPEWVTRNVVIKDPGLTELIEARIKQVYVEMYGSVMERGDKPRRQYAAPIEFDGVVHKAMFGAWRRRAREIKISREGIEALAEWCKAQGVVMKRAASSGALAGQALELIGRQWIE